MTESLYRNTRGKKGVTCSLGSKLNIKQFVIIDTVHSHKSPGVEISEHIYNLKEGNVKLRLAIVDSVGYGDQINKENR